MKYFPHVLLAAVSLLLLPAPALASKLESWRFDNSQNRLEFTTDQDVQPTAQLVASPTRLVIDLPGIVLGRPSFTESISSKAVHSVRFGQYDNSTTRIVVELEPGYTLDPNQVRFQGTTARQWTVQIPQPQPLSSSAPSPSVVAKSGSEESSSAKVASTVVPTISVVTSGALINRQLPTSSGKNLAVTQASVAAAQTGLATIDSVQLENGGAQLVIRANQPLKYNSGWDRSSNSYRITLPSARMAAQIKGPKLDANSPVLKVRLRQENAQTVVILVQPAAGVQISDLNQPTQQTLTLQLQRSRTADASPRKPIAGTPSVLSSPQSNSPALSLPKIPNGRIVVIVDPGHGGPDPGAVGVGGLREKDIVLDISIKVANLLGQQGVQAVLTRKDDIDLDLEPRVQMAQQVNATLFVSIHANSIDLSRPEINGLETYYYESGAGLAKSIHNSVLESTHIPDRGVRTARFYVLRKTSMPSVLVEVGFVTGRDDAARLSDPSYRGQMAAAIARGILQYIQNAARS